MASVQPFLSPRVHQLEASRIREVANAGLGRPDVLAFWFGESDEITPVPVRDAAVTSIEAGETFYSPNLGLPELRSALAAQVSRLHAPPVLASHVVAPLLAEFRRRHPRIRLDIDVETTGEPPIEDYDITLLGTDDRFDGSIVARKVIESEAFLVASPAYLARKGTPQSPQELAAHECLRLKMPQARPGTWRMWCPQAPQSELLVEVQPVLLANHTDSLLRATLDGAGITSIAIDMVASYLTRGELVRVLAPWITGRLTMYAAVPSRKFMPQRTRVFLDFLVEETRKQKATAMQACLAC